MTANASAVLAEVAAAVDLREGPEGVRSVVRALAQAGTRSNKELSRAVSMPIPIVVSILNELRTRGIVESTRPAALSDRGREMFGSDDGPGLYDAAEIDRVCSAVEAALVADGGINQRAPAADVSIDQSHSTVETKVARLRLLLERRYLPVPRFVLIGDDDLVSLTVALGGVHAGRPLADVVTVVDSDPRVLGFVLSALAEMAGRGPLPSVEVVEHDLREPLPPLPPHDLAMTDPPYTVPGASLFLARAVEALHPQVGHRVLFSFGAKPPAEQLELQRAISATGLAITDVRRGFNRYEGAGSIGGSSDLYDLVIGEARSADPEAVDGAIYTADFHVSRQRWYRCTNCGHEVRVGVDAPYTDLDALRSAGCPSCGATTFKPGSKVRDD